MASKKLQLYSLATPNGVKVAVALEELGIEYDAHTVDIRKGEQFEPEFLKISPNNRIPAIVDPEGPDGEPLSLFESGAILVYLAEKTGKLLGETARDKANVLQWLFWQMGGLGPMLGQFNHFSRYAPGADTPEGQEKHEYGRERYRKEGIRLIGVLEKEFQKDSRQYIAGNFLSIADLAIVPWLVSSIKMAEEVLEFEKFPLVREYVERVSSREAYKRGEVVTPFN